MATDVQTHRLAFEGEGLRREALADDPILQFSEWFKAAQDFELHEPTAMSLTTCNAQGQPHIRTVLLKFFDHNGFVFFTNYSSRKALDIAANPRVALLFPWISLSRQVCVEGLAEKVSAAESLRYFATRPRDSQLGAWVSAQSQRISSRGLLEQKMAEIKQKFGNGQIPLPSFWGGYRIVPQRIEFWQGRPHRLHDRFEYQRKNSDSSWVIERLQP